MAQALRVPVDFLTDSGENAYYDKEIVERIDDIQKMDSTTKSALLNVFDSYIQNFKTKKAFIKQQSLICQALRFYKFKIIPIQYSTSCMC